MSRKKITAPAPVAHNLPEGTNPVADTNTSTEEKAVTVSLAASLSASTTPAISTTSSTTSTAVAIKPQIKRYAAMRYGKQGESDLHYTQLLPWELDARIKNKRQDSEDSEGEGESATGYGIFIVEEEFSGRGFTVSENSIYSFLEFLLLCAGRRERQDPNFYSKQNKLNVLDIPEQCKGNLFYLTDDEFSGIERMKFPVHRREMMRRILFNNPVLNQDFMSYIHSQQNIGNFGFEPWQKWQERFWLVNRNGDKAPVKSDVNALKDFVADELSTKLGKNTTLQMGAAISEFEAFYSNLDVLRSTSFDNVKGVDSSDPKSSKGQSNIRWASRMLFPYCQDALYADCNFEKNKTDHALYFKGHGQILFWMLALSGDSERQKRISRLLCANFLDAKNEQAVFTSLLAQADENTTKRDLQTITTQFFPIRHKCELFEHYAEDIEHVLNLNLVQVEMFDVLQRLSSLYLILFLLERSCLIDARCHLNAQEEAELAELMARSKQHEKLSCQKDLDGLDGSAKLDALKFLENKCDIPYFLLVFDSHAYPNKCVKDNYDGILSCVSESLKNFVRFKIERELTNEQYFRIVYPACYEEHKNDDLLPKDLDYLKSVVQQVFAVKSDSDFAKFDFEKQETYVSFLAKVNNYFKKRRSSSKTGYAIDNVVEQLARNIGLISLASNRLQFAVTDGFLKMLVLVACKGSGSIRNKEFLKRIAERYRFIVGEEQFKSLQNELKAKNAGQEQITDGALKQNEDALQERLINQRLCCKLSDNNFYYIFNPYKTKRQSTVSVAGERE